MGVGAGAAGSGGGDGGTDGGEGGTDPAAKGGRLIDSERHWEQIVRSELEKVRTKDDVESLKEEVRKIVERPPRKYRKITSKLWGGGDDE